MLGFGGFFPSNRVGHTSVNANRGQNESEDLNSANSVRLGVGDRGIRKECNFCVKRDRERQLICLLSVYLESEG